MGLLNSPAGRRRDWSFADRIIGGRPALADRACCDTLLA
jgi:hypothetical protein